MPASPSVCWQPTRRRRGAAALPLERRFATPMRTPRVEGAGGGDRIMADAQSLAKLMTLPTPLEGGENPDLAQSDFSGITPRHTIAATPNPLATPRTAGATPAPGATPAGGRAIAGVPATPSVAGTPMRSGASPVCLSVCPSVCWTAGPLPGVEAPRPLCSSSGGLNSMGSRRQPRSEHHIQH
jgi:hypothetical protein